MTINEMLKKVDTYNEMSEMLGVRFGRKVELTMYDTTMSPITYHYTAEDVKSFRKLIKSEYIDRCAKAILEYKDYEFNTPVTLETIDAFGSKQTMLVEFTVDEE